MEKNIIDRLLDENDSDPIVLFTDQNQAVEFEQVAVILWQEKPYVILKPLVAVNGITDDEALVFARSRSRYHYYLI